MTHPAHAPQNSSIYGPVHSWRAGWSLGVDLLLETSICSFDCVYCQLGRIQRHTGERQVFVPTAQVARDLEASAWGRADVVTFSGSGEPTLAANLGEVVALVKARTHKPVLVLTNSTLLGDPAVRADLRLADTVSCKLDATTEAGLQQVNRPVGGVSFEGIVAGIEALRAEHPGRLVLQCMFMPMNADAAKDLARLAARLRPDEVQLNTPRRPYPLERVLESRGNHNGMPEYPSRRLRTVDESGAAEIEAAFHELAPGVPLVSVYRANGT